jgi:hypothetical protein
MIKLSQRAWNNVIIISTLILILLFNFSSNFLNGGSDEQGVLTGLVPVNMTITTIEFKQHKIERIGQGWRSTSSNVTNEILINLVRQWQQAEIAGFAQETSWQSVEGDADNLVKVWFAGQASPIEYRFLELADKSLVQIDNVTYQLTNVDYPTLRLPE